MSANFYILPLLVDEHEMQFVFYPIRPNLCFKGDEKLGL